MASPSRGIVCVFGWMMCKPRHLQKIGAWWSERGFKAVNVAGDPKVLFFPDSVGRKTGQDIARKVTELDMELHGSNSNAPVFFHVFSGQGGATLAHTLRSMPASHRSKVAGIVTDCMAAKMDIDQATLGFKSAFHTAPWLGSLLGPPFWLAGKAVEAVDPKLKQWDQEYHELLMASVNRWQVFHTKTDRYVPHNLVTELVEAKRAVGGDVNYKLWEDGAHVGLFRDHHEEYSSLLDQFVVRAEEEYYAGAVGSVKAVQRSEISDALDGSMPAAASPAD